MFAVRCDVTDAGQVERACKEVVREHGPVQVVVANAGITRDRLLARTSEDLAAEEAAYITGPVIPVDGDLGMGH
ncbi:SDR family oxidoreductase [Streptomyces sioyaensis]|uniref:SDR family oxidoreductase n=1 Tax=Streptomyces sioyaensis TaxID=67364 RepID=UPI003D71FDB4